MRKLGKILGRIIAGLVGIAAVIWWLGPYEPVDLSAEFELRKFGEGVQVYFESIESRYPDITPGTEKRVVWAGQSETRTPISILYLHGFSATSEEIRPVPDRIAQELGANLVFTRLRGHGRGGEAMAGATVADWMYDLAEGLAAARAKGGQGGGIGHIHRRDAGCGSGSEPRPGQGRCRNGPDLAELWPSRSGLSVADAAGCAMVGAAGCWRDASVSAPE
ncbi:hypothetical protein [Sedimentitalea sp.]|uniref:alpha/beta hydrolase n=1 Tax=Sedimentitalea sp. TaxID=2048915 RepID=UPI003297BD25